MMTRSAVTQPKPQDAQNMNNANLCVPINNAFGQILPELTSNENNYDEVRRRMMARNAATQLILQDAQNENDANTIVLTSNARTARHEPYNIPARKLRKQDQQRKNARHPVPWTWWKTLVGNRAKRKWKTVPHTPH